MYIVQCTTICSFSPLTKYKNNSSEELNQLDCQQYTFGMSSMFPYTIIALIFFSPSSNHSKNLYVAVHGICWVKIFHFKVEVVEPRVFVTVTVSVEVAPNSTYTEGKTSLWPQNKNTVGRHISLL